MYIICIYHDILYIYIKEGSQGGGKTVGENRDWDVLSGIDPNRGPLDPHWSMDWAELNFLDLRFSVAKIKVGARWPKWPKWPLLSLFESFLSMMFTHIFEAKKKAESLYSVVFVIFNIYVFIYIYNIYIYIPITSHEGKVGPQALHQVHVAFLMPWPTTDAPCVTRIRTSRCGWSLQIFFPFFFWGKKDWDRWRPRISLEKKYGTGKLTMYKMYVMLGFRLTFGKWLGRSCKGNLR